jgi:integrase
MAESYEKVEKGIIKRGRHFYVGAQNGQKRVRIIALLPDGSPCRTLVQARAALAILKGRVREGRHIPADKRRITVGDILDGLKAHLKTARDGAPVASFDKLAGQIEILRVLFGARRAREWRYKDGADYMATAKTQAERGTLSARLSILRNAFKVARRNDLLDKVPDFPPRVDNVRQGYVTPEAFETIIREFGGVDSQILQFCYLTGQRVQRVLDLHVSDVDVVGWMIKPEPDRGNKSRPMMPLVGAARLIVEDRLRAAGAPGWLLFHREGRRITHHAIYDRWHAVMVKKGLSWTIHDFRRSAARNLVNAGVDPSVAKDITGHRTLTMFNRYSINPHEAVRKAAQQVDAYLADRRASALESVRDLSSGV